MTRRSQSDDQRTRRRREGKPAMASEVETFTFAPAQPGGFTFPLLTSEIKLDAAKPAAKGAKGVKVRGKKGKAPKTLHELLGQLVIDGKGAELPCAATLEDKHVALYFSAHWCPLCKRFTPELAKTYKAIKAARDDFELVFVSGDRDEAQFREYRATMPWLALPFDEKRYQALSSHFEVEGIPTLVLLSPTGKVMTTKGREAVLADPEGKDFPNWGPKQVRGKATNVLLQEKIKEAVAREDYELAARLKQQMTASGSGTRVSATAKFWCERVATGQEIAIDHENSNIHVTRATVWNADKLKEGSLATLLCCLNSNVKPVWTAVARFCIGREESACIMLVVPLGESLKLKVSPRMHACVSAGMSKCVLAWVHVYPPADASSALAC